MSSNIAYYQDQSIHALTNSYVSYPFGFTSGYLRIDNDDTSGSNNVVWSFNGTDIAGTVIPGKYVEIQGAHVGEIQLKYTTGAPNYRLHAMFEG